MIVNATVWKILIFLDSVEDFSIKFLAVEAISDYNTALILESLRDMLSVPYQK